MALNKEQSRGMEVAATPSAISVFFSIPSSSSFSPSAHLPVKNRKNCWLIVRGSLSVSSCSCSQPLPRGEEKVAKWKRKPVFSPVQSPRHSAVAEVVQSSDLESALSRLEKILQVQDLNIILRSFGNSKRWRDVSKLFDWMRKRKRVNVASYSSFIKYMGESRNLSCALEVYNNIEDESTRNNVSICNSLLGCMVKDGKFESSMKMFEEMKLKGLLPDLFTYSTLLAGCSKLENGYSKALELVEELKSRGLGMDSVIYGNILAICAKNNLCEEAEHFFQQMIAVGLSPNLFHYSSLLNAYSVDGNYGKADEIIRCMNTAGIVPNKVILTTLLKVYIRAGLVEKSKELLIELENQGFAENEVPFCLVMDDLAKKGQVDEAKAIFHKMKEKRVASDGYAYSIMISAYCRSGRLKEAKELAKEYETTYDKFDLAILNALLRAYCKGREIENVMQTLRKMDEQRISPDWNTFQILIKYFLKEKLYNLAYKTVEDMNSKGHQLDEELCSSLIVELGQSGAASEAFSVYNMLRYGKTKPRKSIHETILNILIRAKLFKNAYVVMKDNAEDISVPSLDKFALSFMQAGNINMINDVLKALHRAGRGVNQEVFHVAVSRYVARPEKEELLLQLLKWMPGHGYKLSSASRDLLRRSAGPFGQSQLIEEALAHKSDLPAR
ncbi:pentatricopeptide repeat (PPR) superfamily protein [Wolffia australiana]